MTPLFVIVILIIILIFPLETSPRDTSVFQGTAVRRVSSAFHAFFAAKSSVVLWSTPLNMGSR